MQVFKSHVNLLRLIDSKHPITNQELLNRLSNIPFIKPSSSSCYLCPNQLYDGRQILFKIVFESNLLPEIEYLGMETFMAKLGMKQNLDSKDVIEIANTLNKMFNAKKIDLKGIEVYSKKLFLEIYIIKHLMK